MARSFTSRTHSSRSTERGSVPIGRRALYELCVQLLGWSEDQEGGSRVRGASSQTSSHPKPGIRPYDSRTRPDSKAATSVSRRPSWLPIVRQAADCASSPKRRGSARLVSIAQPNHALRMSTRIQAPDRFSWAFEPREDLNTLRNQELSERFGIEAPERTTCFSIARGWDRESGEVIGLHPFCKKTSSHFIRPGSIRIAREDQRALRDWLCRSRNPLSAR